MSRRRKITEAPISLFSFQDLITSLSGILILIVLIMSIQMAVEQAGNPEPASSAQSDVAALQQEVADKRAQLTKYHADQSSLASQDVLENAKSSMQAEREHAWLEDQLLSAESYKEELSKRISLLRGQATSASNKIHEVQIDLDQLRAAHALAIEQSRLFFIPEKGSLKTPVLVECSDTIIRVGYIDRNDPPVSIPASAPAEFLRHLKGLSPENDYIVFMIKPSGLQTYSVLREVATTRGFEVGYDALEEGHSIALGSEAL